MWPRKSDAALWLVGFFWNFCCQAERIGVMRSLVGSKLRFMKALQKVSQFKLEYAPID